MQDNLTCFNSCSHLLHPCTAILEPTNVERLPQHAYRHTLRACASASMKPPLHSATCSCRCCGVCGTCIAVHAETRCLEGCLLCDLEPQGRDHCEALTSLRSACGAPSYEAAISRPPASHPLCNSTPVVKACVLCSQPEQSRCTFSTRLSLPSSALCNVEVPQSKHVPKDHAHAKLHESAATICMPCIPTRHNDGDWRLAWTDPSRQALGPGSHAPTAHPA